MPHAIGKVYLVGAGPGDPGLITVRGVECLRLADVVICDYLVNPRLLDHLPPTTACIRLGHHHSGGFLNQDEINEAMIREAKEGKTVVRLKGGDPDVFGRSAEETTALRDAGIPFEIVPGVTAALAAAGYAAIPITHAELSSAVALVTGTQRESQKDRPMDYAALASFPGTLLFYMGVKNAANWTTALLGGGKSPDTPVAIVRRCACADQTIYRATLGTLVEVIANKKIRPPAVVVVGEVVDLMPTISWFNARPLFGQKILVTRPREEGDSLIKQLDELGAEVLVQPAISISPPDDYSRVDDVIRRLPEFEWVVFSSVHGVRFFLDRLLTHGDIRRWGTAKIACIGPGTAEALLAYRLQADMVPGEFRAEALAEALIPHSQGKKVLLVRASRGRDVLPERLREAGVIVEQVVAYLNEDVARLNAEIADRLAAGEIDWITVTSSTIARSLKNLFGDALKKSKLASLSPVTSGVLRELGFEPMVEAAEYTMPGLVEAIRKG